MDRRQARSLELADVIFLDDAQPTLERLRSLE
jgi:hypothetical protein